MSSENDDVKSFPRIFNLFKINESRDSRCFLQSRFVSEFVLKLHLG